MKTLKNWTLLEQSANHLELLVDSQHRLCLYVLEQNLFRVLIKRKGQLSLNKTWSIAPDKDVPWEGRERDDLSGFTCPTWTLTQQDDTLVVATDALRGLHAQNQPVSTAMAGQRIALNISGDAEKADLSRGDWLLSEKPLALQVAIRLSKYTGLTLRENITNGSLARLDRFIRLREAKG